MNVHLNPAARAQLLAARNYIRAHNPSAAQKFRKQVESALRRLGSFPDIGHIIPEAPDGVHRQIIVEQYRFFYRVAGNRIWIVAVGMGNKSRSHRLCFKKTRRTEPEYQANRKSRGCASEPVHFRPFLGGSGPFFFSRSGADRARGACHRCWAHHRRC